MLTIGRVIGELISYNKVVKTNKKMIIKMRNSNRMLLVATNKNSTKKIGKQ